MNHNNKMVDDLSFFLTCDLKELCEGADRIREYFIGEKVDLCSVINGRSGRCSEDCKYCAKSVYNHTDCEVYDFLPEEKIVEMCKLNESELPLHQSVGKHPCATIRSDRKMLQDLQRDVTRII